MILATFERFKGKNNTKLSSNFTYRKSNEGGVVGTELEECLNFDITNDGNLELRDSFEIILPNQNVITIYKYNDDILFQTPEGLKKYNPKLQVITTIDTDIAQQPLVYCEIGGILFYSDGVILKCIGGNSDPIPDKHDFLAKLPAGNILAYYMGRLYSIKSKYIFYSEPYRYLWYDTRKNFIPMKERITMFLPTPNGIYISTINELYFIRGRKVDEFIIDKIANFGALYGTGQILLDDNIVIFSNKNHICIGDFNGKIIQLEHYKHTDVFNSGVSCVNIKPNKNLVILTLRR
jgi:hypothetical protein